MNKAASLYKAVVLLWHTTAKLEDPYYHIIVAAVLHATGFEYMQCPTCTHPEFHSCLFSSPQFGLYSFRAHTDAERLSSADPGISRGLTDLYPSRGYTHHDTRDRSTTRTLQK